MAHVDHHEQMQNIFAYNHSMEELDTIIEARKVRATEAHAAGAYTSAKEMMLTASLARQLKELKEEIRDADKHDADEN